jgi:superfamily II DNA or RNA helicase
MVREGFNDVDTDCGVIMATTLSESFHIQTIGRIIRFKPGKMATIHILLANNTSDLEVLKYTDNYDFELHDIILPDKTFDKYKESYYSGKKYSFCENRLWEKDLSGMGRIAYKPHPILKELRKVKPEGGSFVVSGKQVLMKLNDKIVLVVEDDNIKFELEEKKLEDLSWNNIVKDWRKG